MYRLCYIMTQTRSFGAQFSIIGRWFPLLHQTSRVYAYSPSVMEACIPDVLKAVVEDQAYAEAIYWTRVKGLGTETRAVNRRGLRQT